MSRYSELQIWMYEADLIREALREPLDEHLKILYLRGVNKYFKSTKTKRR